MGLIYYGCGGWARHVNEFFRSRRPIPKPLREALRHGVEQDRIELGLIAQAIAGSDELDPLTRNSQLATHTPGRPAQGRARQGGGRSESRTKRTAKRPAAGTREASRRKPRNTKAKGAA